MNEPVLSPWQLLLLSCLYAAGEKGESAARLRKLLEKWMQPGAASEQDDQLQFHLKKLAMAGHCIAEKAGRSPRWRIAPAGRESVSRLLGLQSPNQPCTWKEMTNIYLPGCILNCVPASKDQTKKLGSLSGLRAAILNHAYGLNMPGMPAFKQALDAFLWRQLDVESKAPFSLEAVKSLLLQRALGISGSPLKSSQLQAALAGCAVGAKRNDPAALREAIVRSWLQSEADALTAAQAEEMADRDWADFANQTMYAAKRCAEGRFGDSLVFINHLYRRYREQHPDTAPSLQAFKGMLVEAQRRDLVSLVRADLVAAMNATDVAESEVCHLNATFHFIRIQ